MVLPRLYSQSMSPKVTEVRAEQRGTPEDDEQQRHAAAPVMQRALAPNLARPPIPPALGTPIPGCPKRTNLLSTAADS